MNTHMSFALLNKFRTAHSKSCSETGCCQCTETDDHCQNTSETAELGSVIAARSAIIYRAVFGFQTLESV